jgi:hypothetical protein
MANNNDVVMIELDRPRELRFGYKAMKKMAALSDGNIERYEDGAELANLDELEEIFLFGLEKDAKEHGEVLTLDKIADLLDYAPSLEYLTQKIEEAFKKGGGRNSGNVPVEQTQNRAMRRAKR